MNQSNISDNNSLIVNEELIKAIKKISDEAMDRVRFITGNNELNIAFYLSNILKSLKDAGCEFGEIQGIMSI